MPAPSWRTYPEPATGTYDWRPPRHAGASRRVGMNSFDQRCMECGVKSFFAPEGDQGFEQSYMAILTGSHGRSRLALTS